MPRLVAAFVRVHMGPAIPGLIATGFLVLWAADNGGYDAGTWYWGALLTLSMLALVASTRLGRRRLSRPTLAALACLAAFTLWSYASIAWSASPGDALGGSNRTLLYLLVFTLFALLPWTPASALVTLTLYVLGVGGLALVLLWRLATGDHVGLLVIEGRLAAPTGYFNSSVALFTVLALVATTLALRRELPGVVRGLLIALATAGLQLALVGESRGWLVTLPLVLIVAIWLVRERFRAAGAALIPIVATLVPIHALLGIFTGSTTAALGHAGEHAGRVALVWCAGAFVVGTVLAWIDPLVPAPQISARGRRAIGGTLAGLALLAAVAGGVAATHGHPVRFIDRQLNGFTSPVETGGTSSHFGTVGSGRYDFWRVSLEAFLAHPIGGLGQDNFADYYILHRRTAEDPLWPHSLELRLLEMTGIVGFALFAGFVVLALLPAVRVVRRGRGLEAQVAAAALLPSVDWLIHGSVDWFWEMPALAGPAFAFLGMSLSLAARHELGPAPAVARLRLPRAVAPVAPGIGILAVAAIAAVLGLPYLSVSEQTIANSMRYSNPAAALQHLTLAARFDPLSSLPGRLAGTIALQTGLYEVALSRYQQSIDNERGGWFAWFGQGLAASALGERRLARHDFEVALRIENRQPAISDALARVDTPTPLTPQQALSELVAKT